MATEFENHHSARTSRDRAVGDAASDPVYRDRDSFVGLAIDGPCRQRTGEDSSSPNDDLFLAIRRSRELARKDDVEGAVLELCDVVALLVNDHHEPQDIEPRVEAVLRRWGIMPRPHDLESDARDYSATEFALDRATDLVRLMTNDVDRPEVAKAWDALRTALSCTKRGLVDDEGTPLDPTPEQQREAVERISKTDMPTKAEIREVLIDLKAMEEAAQGTRNEGRSYDGVTAGVAAKFIDRLGIEVLLLEQQLAVALKDREPPRITDQARLVAGLDTLIDGTTGRGALDTLRGARHAILAPPTYSNRQLQAAIDTLSHVHLGDGTRLGQLVPGKVLEGECAAVAEALGMESAK